jgi:hypothetical protein
MLHTSICATEKPCQPLSPVRYRSNVAEGLDPAHSHQALMGLCLSGMTFREGPYGGRGISEV